MRKEFKRYLFFVVFFCNQALAVAGGNCDVALDTTGQCGAQLKSTEQNSDSEKKMVVVTASYNNIKWAEENLNSVFMQKYKNFRVIYYDDCSTDGTGDYVEAYKKIHGLDDNKLIIFHNKVRVGAHLNIYRAVHSCAPTDIIVTLDGDDRLCHDGVFKRLNKEYQDPNVWLTYGQYYLASTGEPGKCCKMSQKTLLKGSYRKDKFVATHLRTFYAWLYKRVHVEDFICEGRFIDCSGDVLIMFAMLEMADGRFKFIPDFLLCYNDQSEINTCRQKHKKDPAFKKWHDRVTKHIKNDIAPYAPLQRADFC